MCSRTRPRIILSSEKVGRQLPLKQGLRHLYLVRTEWITHPSTDRGRRCLTCYELEGDLRTELQGFLCINTNKNIAYYRPILKYTCDLII